MSRAMSMGTLQKTKQVADEIGTPASLLAAAAAAASS